MTPWMKFAEPIMMWTQQWRATEKTQDFQKQLRQSHSGYTNLPRCGVKLVWPPTPHLRIKDFVAPDGVDSATLTIRSVFSNDAMSFISFIHYHNAKKWSSALRFWRIPNWLLSVTGLVPGPHKP